MTTQTKGRREANGIASLPVFRIFNDAIGLARRFTEGETFRHYVEERLRLVVPMCCLMLLVGVACSAGVMLFLGEIGRALVLLGVIVMPVVLVGALFVQAYVFFSWLENRSLAQRNHPLASPAMGPLPEVPWLLAAAVVLVPFAMLLYVAWKAALVILALAVLAPVLYAALDR
jgi:hypothetical protein